MEKGKFAYKMMLAQKLKLNQRKGLNEGDNEYDTRSMLQQWASISIIAKISFRKTFCAQVQQPYYYQQYYAQDTNTCSSPSILILMDTNSDRVFGGKDQGSVTTSEGLFLSLTMLQKVLYPYSLYRTLCYPIYIGFLCSFLRSVWPPVMIFTE